MMSSLLIKNQTTQSDEQVHWQKPKTPAWHKTHAWYTWDEQAHLGLPFP